MNNQNSIHKFLIAFLLSIDYDAIFMNHEKHGHVYSEKPQKLPFLYHAKATFHADKILTEGLTSTPDQVS